MFVFYFLPALLNCSSDRNCDENAPNPVESLEQADALEQAGGIQPPQQNPNVEEHEEPSQNQAEQSILTLSDPEDQEMVDIDSLIILDLIDSLSKFWSRSFTIENISENLRDRFSEHAIFERFYTILLKHLNNLQECVSSLDFNGLSDSTEMPRIAQSEQLQEDLEAFIRLARIDTQIRLRHIFKNFCHNGIEFFLQSVLQEFFDFSAFESEELKLRRKNLRTP